MHEDTHQPAELAFSVVIPAAGTGVRMGGRMGGRKKPYLRICGRPVLHIVIDTLSHVSGCAEIIPVLHPDEYEDGHVAAELRSKFGITKIARGGATRQESAFAGLQLVREDLDLVLTHDAVRPLVDPDVIRRVAEAVQRFGAAIAAVPATETVKEVGAEGRIIATPPRDTLWLARTPQGFRKELILRAYAAAQRDGYCGTDDAELVERLGEDARVVEDAYSNLKITTEEDLAAAEAIYRWREGRRGGADAARHASFR